MQIKLNEMNNILKNILLIIIVGNISIAYSGPIILSRNILDGYVDRFNAVDKEEYKTEIPNCKSADFLFENVPLFECPDKNIEEIYYFRWWTFRKHIRNTPNGYVVTEFLPDVGWAGKFNAISCPAWFHYLEARWMYNNKYLTDYTYYWLKGEGNPHHYSFPIADALKQFCLVTGDFALMDSYYSELKANFDKWENMNYDSSIGLFEQIDDRDGMEMSIGGSGYRVTINSYMAAELYALSESAARLGNVKEADLWKNKANKLTNKMFSFLWDRRDSFFKVVSKEKKMQNVREIHGYTPWAYLSVPNKYSEAWKFLMDTRHFFAPYGPTTAEQCHPDFRILYQGHECQWNGPSWPYSTAMTLYALANHLNNDSSYINKSDYLTLMSIYATSQHLISENGERIPWIDENLNPFTGDWISRTMLINAKSVMCGRGRDYNHSSYCDLVISGLIGIRPQNDNTLVVNPLIPNSAWDYFCLDGILYHGRIISVIYDKYGTKYGKGKGLIVFVDGKLVAQSNFVTRLEIEL